MGASFYCRYFSGIKKKMLDFDDNLSVDVEEVTDLKINQLLSVLFILIINMLLRNWGCRIYEVSE